VHDEVMPALGIKLKLVQLIAENEWQETFEQNAQGQWVNYRYDWMHTEAGLQKLATIAAGVGPSYAMLVSAAGSDKPAIAPFTGWAHAAGLQIHPYTFRSDDGQLPAWVTRFDELLQFFLFDVGVDGVFTDFPDKAVQFLQQH
jgi:glycerophosphoryl diester phosphodiesterase